MGNGQIEFESGRAMKNTYRFQEKTFTDTVIGTPYAMKVTEFLKKIEEVLEG